MCKKTMPTPKNEDTSGDQGPPFISIGKEVRPLRWARGRIAANLLEPHFSGSRTLDAEAEEEENAHGR